MADEGTSTTKEQTAPDPDDARKPDSPSQISGTGWRYTAKRALAEFQNDQCTDLAAALTYYSVLAIFPGLVAVVSLLGVFGQGEQTTQTLLDLIRQTGQADVARQLEGPISQMTQSSGAGVALFAGLAGALWSASSYVGAFGRALNRIYEIDEGRPIWKLRPLQVLLTLVCVVLAALVLVGLVVSGPLASSVGESLGIGQSAVTAWNIAKVPVILLIVVVLVALLYHATPNVRQPKISWMSPGAALAIVTWILASAAFGFYVANFGSYNKTYGSLAGIIIFLLWLWLTNLALLFGAQVDAELERTRQLQAGIEAEETLQLPPRDTRQSDKRARKQEKHIEEGRAIRENAQNDDAEDGSQDRSGHDDARNRDSHPSAGDTRSRDPRRGAGDGQDDRDEAADPSSPRQAMVSETGDPDRDRVRATARARAAQPRGGLPGLVRRARAALADRAADRRHRWP